METVTEGITVEVLGRFVDVATDALAEAREEIDALNVYPIPDGDTGTNMFLTVSAARDALREARATGPLDLPAAMALISRAALMGARGNSGVILSQMLRAFAHRMVDARPGETRAQVWARAVQAATDASYAAVGTPVEGTILTVARAASDAALAASENGDTTSRTVVVAAARAAREALARTPEQLPVLAAAGVVDAGGRGLCVVLDAVETVSTGRRPVPPTAGLTARHIPVAHVPGEDLTEGGPAYEVMYLLDAEDEAVTALRSALAGLGDSLVVVGGDGLWNVHVHVDDVGAAIEAGITAGRPYRVKVTHFAEQVDQARARKATRTGRKVVAVAAGPGLAELYQGAGAVVVEGGPGRRPSTGQLLEAILATGASEVVLLPNDGESVRAAEIAAHTASVENGIRVEVISTSAQVQGLAALAVHEPGRSFDADVREMTATARHVRHGGVTVAARQAITMAGPCEPGDVLGVVAGDFAVVGKELAVVAEEIVERLLAGGGELVTLVAGEGGREVAAATARSVEERHPAVDVLVYEGGQDRYPLLMSVE